LSKLSCCVRSFPPRPSPTLSLVILRTTVPATTSGYGPGFFIAGFGGTPADFFNTLGYAPGSTLGGFTDIFFSDGFAKIGPSSSEIFYNVGTLFLSTITFPTNGQNFRAPVSVGFDAIGTSVDTGNSFEVSGGADGYIGFYFSNGTYFADSRGFVETPEPGTLSLLCIGVLGVIARGGNKLFRRS
jgi:hypothetical protein